MMSVLKAKKTWIILIVVILIFTLIQAKGLNHRTLGDEFTYFYMGKLVSEGNLPYKDFFFAHPPLQLIFFALIFKLFGFNLILLKAVPLLFNIISSVFLFKIMKKHSDTHALISTILFLFTYTIMLEATYSYGIEIATAFVLISVFYLTNNKSLIGGIFYGIASITALQSLILVPAIIIYLFLKRNGKHLTDFLMGFLSVFLIVNLFLMLLFSNYFTDVYKFHLIKPKIGGDNFRVFTNFILDNLFLIGSFILFFIINLKNNFRKYSLFIFIIIAYLLFLIISSRIFTYYFIILIPFIAILASQGLISLSKKIKTKNIKYFFIIFVLIIFLINVFSTTNVLYKKDFRDFQSLDELTAFIKTNSKSADEIFGDLYTAPMLALFADRKIAFNFVDTNGLRFLSDLPPIEEVLQKVNEEKIKFVIVRPKLGIGTSVEMHDFLRQNCVLAKHVKDPVFEDIFIYDCSENENK